MGFIRVIERVWTYHSAWLRVWLGFKPETDDEVQAWCLKQMVLLWNREAGNKVSLGTFLTASSESRRYRFFLGRGAPFFLFWGFLGWPLVALVISRQRKRSDWWENWLVSIKRPDLPMAVGRGPFRERDTEETLSCLPHVILGKYYYIHRPSPGFRMDDKPVFHQLCAEQGLPTVPMVSVDAVQPARFYIAKPHGSCQGRGVRKLLGAEVSSTFDPETELLQECLRNVPEIEAWVGEAGGLSTLRVVTLRRADSGIAVLGAFVRFATKGSIVDNFHAGGIASPVDLTTGILQAGTTEEAQQSCWDHARNIRAHPDTGVEFAGRMAYPQLEEARELCLRAHRLLGPELMLCSWDVVPTAEGPVLLEASSSLGGGLELLHKPDVRLYRDTLRHFIGEIEESAAR